MNKEIRILFMMMCAAALALGSCAKHSIAPEEDQQEVIDFTAKSQASWVKSDEPAFPYQNFGVWGIATKENSESTYLLWPGNQLTEVKASEETSASQSTSSAVYTPVTTAYWLYGYTHSFYAVAPYNPEGFVLTGMPTKENPSDNIAFTYDISSNYSGSSVNYTFDLLGAAAKHKVETGGYNTSQDLTFWHLFSQIEITNISFGKDAAGNQINGTVNEIRLKSYPKGVYTLQCDNNNGNTTPRGITCVANADNTNKIQATFTNPAFGREETTKPIVNIVPQDVANLELYIDFTIKANENDAGVRYNNFQINLNNQELTKYEPNGKYNWSITIGAKNTISFDVKVSEWETISNIPEFELK